MKLHVKHETIFAYDGLIREQIGEARVQPRNEAGQRLHTFRLSIEPQTPLNMVGDRFGNVVHCYSVLPEHNRLVVTGVSVVETSAEPLLPSPPLTFVQRHEFLSASQYAPCTPELARFAEAQGGGASVEERARALMTAIYDTCEYEPGSTDISTTADAVLAGRRGVCQDFAHLHIALCRWAGLPARYVSGYLRDPAARPNAVLASHAWTEVYLEGQGWLGLDPTHNQATTEDYVRVAVGRDYADATPVRGVFKGGAKETMEVHVRVTEARA